jgi:cystathionine beta-lyase/cystathionine gamma-synthase
MCSIDGQRREQTVKFDTRVVRAGLTPDPTTGAIVPPLYQTATYVLDEVGKDKGFDYTRSSNPTRQMLEEHLAAIEGGRYGVCFASGMATVDSCLKMLKSGDHVVCSDDVYGGVSRLFNQLLTKYDLSFTYVDTSSPGTVKEAIRPETKLLWVETPTNPLLKVTDLEIMGRIAKEHGLLFGVDSTFATPVFLRPLEFGADVAVHSTTKYLSGHNQLIGGIVMTSSSR